MGYGQGLPKRQPLFYIRRGNCCVEFLQGITELRKEGRNGEKFDQKNRTDCSGSD